MKRTRLQMLGTLESSEMILSRNAYARARGQEITSLLRMCEALNCFGASELVGWVSLTQNEKDSASDARNPKFVTDDSQKESLSARKRAGNHYIAALVRSPHLFWRL